MTIQEKFPSIRPSLNLDFANTKTLDPRVTFSRASTATYYDGKTVAKAEENLLLYSQEFDKAQWSKTGATITSDAAVAPDGTTTADALIETTAADLHVAFRAAIQLNVSLTLSVWVKANGRTFALLGNTDHAISVNLTTGVASSTQGSPANIFSVSAGNGWYRIGFTASFFGGNTFSVYASQDGLFANRSYTGDGTSGIYIWGAQLEQRSSVTAYTPTTNQPITNYIPVLRTAAANVARFDHNPVTGESLGLLIEEQRTNLLRRSQEFISPSPWAIQGATVVNNATVALDGSQTAALLVANLGYVYNDNSASVLSQFITLTGGTTYTWSIYAKAAGVGSLAIRNNWTGGITIYNLTDELTTANKQFIGNGWYRCFVTYTPSSTSTNGFSWRPFVSGGTADGVGGVLLWGAQLEAGAFPTSYIKTEASQVTRSADAASMTGANFSSWFRADAGSIMSEAYSFSGLVATPRVVSIQEATPTTLNQAVIGADVMRVRVNGSDIGSFFTSQTISGKYTLAYSEGSNAGSKNGVVQSSSNAGLPRNLVAMYIGQSSAMLASLNGHIRKIAYYPARLTNTQLQALTT